MNSFLKKKGFIILISIILLVSFFLIVSFSFILLFRKKGINDGKISHDFQFYQFNSLNRSTLGVAAIFDDLKDGENFHYFDKDGSLVMIAKFGLQKYKCTVICYCGETERRHIPSLGGQGLILLSVFVFGLMGVGILANKLMEKECDDELSDVCETDEEVKAELKECEGVDEEEKPKKALRDQNPDDSVEWLEEDEEDEEYENPDGIEAVYMCQGHCLVNNKLNDPKRHRYSVSYNCEILNLKMDLIPMLEDPDHTDKQRVDAARQKFIDSYLISFCEEYSLVAETTETEDGYVTGIHYNSCVGGYETINDNFGNPSVVCTKI